MINSGNHGLAALLTGETDTACRRSARNSRSAAKWSSGPWRLKASVASPPSPTVHGDTKRAATLVGAAATHRYDNAEDPVGARLDSTFFEPARTRYGAAAWNAAAREGSAFTFEAAIAYALEEPPG